MMLYGRFEYNVDAKGRIFIPVKLREKLGSSFIAATVLDMLGVEERLDGTSYWEEVKA